VRKIGLIFVVSIILILFLRVCLALPPPIDIPTPSLGGGGDDDPNDIPEDNSTDPPDDTPEDTPDDTPDDELDDSLDELDDPMLGMPEIDPLLLDENIQQIDSSEELRTIIELQSKTITRLQDQISELVRSIKETESVSPDNKMIHITYGIIIFFLIVIMAGGVFILNNRKGNLPTQPRLVPQVRQRIVLSPSRPRTFPNPRVQQVKDYLIANIRKGHSPTVLKEHLRRVGFTREEIELAELHL